MMINNYNITNLSSRTQQIMNQKHNVTRTPAIAIANIMKTTERVQISFNGLDRLDIS